MQHVLARALQALALAAVVLQLQGCALFYQYEAISEKPPVEGSDAPLEPRLSTLQPSLTAPLTLLQQAANVATDKVLPISENDSQRIASLEIMKPWWLGGGCFICDYLDLDWHYTASKPKPITVTGADNKLAVMLPAEIKGGGGFRGEIAKWLSLTNKSFGAGAEITFKSGLGANINYCPTLVGTELDYRWNPEPYFQFIGRSCVIDGNFCFGPWNLEFGTLIDRQIRPKLGAIASELQQNVPCEPIRTELAKVWRKYSFPVKVPYDELHLNIVPRSLYFPGLGVTDKDIVFSGRLDATASLDPALGGTEPLPFPQNVPLPISPGRFSVAVPISTRYYTLNALAKQAVEQAKLSTSTSLGDVLVTPMSVEMFPTADGAQLALGVSVAVEFQYLFFLNTSGTVWLTAKPEALNSGRKIRLSNVKVTRKFTNPAWDLASVLLDTKISEAVEKGFEVDLDQALSKAEADITSAINGAGQGGTVNLAARDVKLSVGRMLAAEKAFQLEVIFDALVEANLGRVSAP